MDGTPRRNENKRNRHFGFHKHASNDQALKQLLVHLTRHKLRLHSTLDSSPHQNETNPQLEGVFNTKPSQPEDSVRTITGITAVCAVEHLLQKV